MTTLSDLLERLSPFGFEFLKFSNGLLLLAIVFVPVERVFGRHGGAISRTTWKNDVTYYFLTSLLPQRLIVVPLIALVWALQPWAPRGMFPTLADLPWGLRFALSLIVAEIGAYWGHRLMHSVNWLWRFHAVHHSAERLDWLVNTRAHPVDHVVTRLCGLIPLYVLGLAGTAGHSLDTLPLFVTITGGVWGYFIHANLRWRLGCLHRVVTTPAFHHLHHARLQLSERGHGNYAAILPLVDWAFGTYKSPGKNWPESYGIDESVGRTLLDQIMIPFMGARKDHR